MIADDSSGGTPSGLLNLQSRLHFTGRLDVKANDQQWGVYLYMGRLIWAIGGSHPVRRWNRYLAQHCPQINSQALLSSLEVDDGQPWDYQVLTVLVKQQQISVEQSVALIRSTVSEVLFDIIQQEETKPVTIKCDRQDVLDISLALVHAEQTVQDIQQVWNGWRALGLVDHSPDLAPVLRQKEQLKQQTSERVYKTLVNLVDGRRTLRDLSALTKQDLVPLMRGLLPFFHKGFIVLLQVPDLPAPVSIAANSVRPTSVHSTSISATATLSTSSPLVAYVDDSPRECEIMEQILTQAGYRFLGVQDSIQALPLLLEKKPSLIFLDLVMPIASGYEICAQIRRISLFKNTPIVIVTNNDGIIDRVRAKVVGSSGFISKPVNAEKVLAIVRKYLPVEEKGNQR
jgi:chemotaxis family two-component system response regulator PixG